MDLSDMTPSGGITLPIDAEKTQRSLQGQDPTPRVLRRVGQHPALREVCKQLDASCEGPEQEAPSTRVSL
jgi:hypothetical protein